MARLGAMALVGGGVAAAILSRKART
jgi:hypothetical protein